MTSVLPAPSATSRTGSTTAEADVRAMLRLWTTAEYRGLVDVVEEMLTDDFLGVDRAGQVLDKPAWVARRRDGRLFHTTFTVDHVDLRLHGDSAIAIGDHECAGHDQGETFGRRCRITAVGVRDGRLWKLASVHISEAPDQSGSSG
ncbi:MAG: nuclear transport factor 2 family protein [Hamadaea sp.]|nr:nuclear transport factor 2 family protein [Hamadaea sp.]NUR49401.1 nuclear transport factor 2 family protein [Hamadaea sp.]NUT08494.1 nuclear transport factor 2 family protein [Hamadaea sp.]